jgi:hypothetical protein
LGGVFKPPGPKAVGHEFSNGKTRIVASVQRQQDSVIDDINGCVYGKHADWKLNALRIKSF